MTLKIYQVDAFATSLFKGNPAAVCPLEHWPEDQLMQQIAMENNLAETAFYIKEEERYLLRWFTPTTEVDLCGHATLAAAWVIFNSEDHVSDKIIFHSPRSGRLEVKRDKELYTLNFPADELHQLDCPPDLRSCFDRDPVACYKGKTDYMLVFESQADIENIVYDLMQIKAIEARGIIITAPGEESDFVSRFFAPQSGVDEDPVTGSAHTSLTPYWTERLGKEKLTAIQLSERKGHLQCRLADDRVEISGEAQIYMEGFIHLP
ncbi:PhzF family phenazine biosynthesis protein [Robertkochia aurantiaca]|uniref:PhzF family phenazine biosynthesis protein n=1 Tax=Robertkochia aurantiaca TaxID=2873700 RepID=UPI001CCAE2F5|nr:PhzF family phenazine biosynthesis protein [Robertkochia sp. 3YJGBD-33]